ncbi:MAG TPA: sulfite oxidase [Terriglobales bacterium]|nr:sulfite oxidase [Terriglobales bacterium]
MISRRDFLLNATGVALAGAAAHPLLSWAADSKLSVPGKEGLIVRSYRFFDLETPVEYFDTWLTPAERFFVRNHMHEPSTLNAADWKLTISGEVENPITLTLADLAKLERHSVVNTLECAGNGRAFHNPNVPGVQWQKGAVSTGRFTGPRLRDILQKAGVKSTGKHVAFRGLDEVPGKVPPFIRSIPIDKALDSDTLIATQLNGSPLPKHNGYPARALTPGWIGAASCKWLTEIKVLEKEFEGNFMSPGYRMPNQPVKPGEAVKPEDTHPVTALNVKSLISSPQDGATLRSPTVKLQGVAWAGEADVVKVEISTDGGTSWSPAQLGKDHARYAWRLFHHQVKLPGSGDFVVMSRATDSQGRIQPAIPVWNPSGYLNNAIDQVKIHVEA